MSKQEYTPKRRWRIECTEEKLRLIANSVEDITRFIGGQPQMMYCLSLFDHSNEIGEYMRQNVRPMMNLGMKGDCVCWDGRDTTNKYVRREVAQGYATYKSILHALATEYDWDNVHSGFILTCEEGGASWSGRFLSIQWKWNRRGICSRLCGIALRSRI